MHANFSCLLVFIISPSFARASFESSNTSMGTTTIRDFLNYHGASNPDQVISNAATCEVTLDDDTLQQIEGILDNKPTSLFK